ncbi:sulfur carrier protein ThiS adenylyltransferase ThiF [Natronospora cellulosivora (SeqCode)]
MNDFEREICAYIGEDNFKKVQSCRIGIAGAGGLGSNAAFNLVRSAFKKFTIVDFDKIDYSNLNRQFYFYNQVARFKVEALKENLLMINPDLDIEVIKIKVDKGNIRRIFKDCSVIIEAFDNVASKKMIVEEYLNSSKLLISASGLAGWGNSDEIVIRKINNSSYMLGDFKSEVNEFLAAFSPRVNIVAAKQADIVLDHILEGS